MHGYCSRCHGLTIYVWVVGGRGCWLFHSIGKVARWIDSKMYIIFVIISKNEKHMPKFRYLI